MLAPRPAAGTAPSRPGPRPPEGNARAAQNALKHGLHAQKHVVLPDEKAAEFEAFAAAILADLAPEGALQTLLARRVAVAAWRLERADRLEAEVLEVRSYEGANAGIALIRDGNGTRSFETLLRYRGAAMAEFWRALRTLKALQAEQAAAELPAAAPVLLARERAPAARVSADRRREPNEPERPQPRRPSAPPAVAHGPQPNEPERPQPCRASARRAIDQGPKQHEPKRRPGSPPQRCLAYGPPATLAPGHTLQEPAVPWTPNQAPPDRCGQPEANGARPGPAPEESAPRIPRVAWTA
jgi:hypothetical protein